MKSPIEATIRRVQGNDIVSLRSHCGMCDLSSI